MKSHLILTLTAVIIFISCQPGQVEEFITSEESQQNREVEVLESAINSVSASLDEQAQEDFVSVRQKTNMFKSATGHFYPIASAHAAQCYGRAAGQFCDNGKKIISYSECSIGLSDNTLSGIVELNYSQIDCSLTEKGDYVKRTFELEKKRPDGSIINISSKERQDYRGLSYGGGALLTVKDNNIFSLQVLGKHKSKVTSAAEHGFNISIRSTKDLEIDKDLSRQGRIIKNGTLEIAHNRLKYLSTLDFLDVQYAPDCCRPISGSINISYTGSISGSKQINFISCDQAELIEGSVIKTIEMKTCE